MFKQFSARRSVVALTIGVLVGGGLLAVTPAGAEVSTAAATNWKKIWKKNLRPQADKRYYTKRVSNRRYARKGALADHYTKADADARFAAAGSSYSKTEIDAKLAPFVNSVSASSGGDQSLALAAADQVVRSVSLMPPADGQVIVSSSAYVQVAGAGISRCSLTQGSAIDFEYLQIVTSPGGAFHPTSGTRGFPVTKGNLLTVNLVCDVFSGTATLEDSSLTAIYAPS